MIRKIEKRIDLGNRHSLRGLPHLHDFVARTHFAFIQNAEVESRTATGGQQRRHSGVVHSAYLRYGPESLLISKFLPWFGTLGPPLAGMFNLAIWRFLLIDSGGALLWAGAYIASGWLFRRQLEDVAAALSRFGASDRNCSRCRRGGVSDFQIRSPIAALPRLPHSSDDLRRTQARMEAGEPLVVVDLRADIERQEGCIPGAMPVELPGPGLSGARYRHKRRRVLLLLPR